MDRPARLSQAYIRGITEPSRYSDGRGACGLTLLVKPRVGGGLSRVWTQRLRTPGGKKDIGLGVWPSVSLEEARMRAFDNWRANREGGALPRKQQPVAPELSGVPTFAELAEKVVQERAQGWKNEKTARIWRARLGQFTASISAHPVDQITAGDVRAVIAPLWSTKHAMAAKVLQYCTSIFDRAVAEDLRADNPAARVGGSMPKVKRVVQHHASLPATEIPAALDSIARSASAETTKLCVEFIVLTAARSGEARGARWEEVDMDSAVWEIPGERMKSGRPHRVPLSSGAVDVLRRARVYAGHSGLLFPVAERSAHRRRHTLEDAAHVGDSRDDARIQGVVPNVVRGARRSPVKSRSYAWRTR